MQRQSRHNKFMSPVLYFFVKHKNIQAHNNFFFSFFSSRFSCGPPRNKRNCKRKTNIESRHKKQQDDIARLFLLKNFAIFNWFFFSHYQIIIVALKFWIRRNIFFCLSGFLFYFFLLSFLGIFRHKPKMFHHKYNSFFFVSGKNVTINTFLFCW